MKKKFLTLIVFVLIICLAVCFVGCVDKDDKGLNTSPSPSVSPSPSASPSPSPSPSPEPTGKDLATIAEVTDYFDKLSDDLINETGINASLKFSLTFEKGDIVIEGDKAISFKEQSFVCVDLKVDGLKGFIALTLNINADVVDLPAMMDPDFNPSEGLPYKNIIFNQTLEVYFEIIETEATSTEPTETLIQITFEGANSTYGYIEMPIDIVGLIAPNSGMNLVELLTMGNQSLVESIPLITGFIGDLFEAKDGSFVLVNKYDYDMETGTEIIVPITQEESEYINGSINFNTLNGITILQNNTLKGFLFEMESVGSSFPSHVVKIELNDIGSTIVTIPQATEIPVDSAQSIIDAIMANPAIANFMETFGPYIDAITEMQERAEAVVIALNLSELISSQKAGVNEYFETIPQNGVATLNTLGNDMISNVTSKIITDITFENDEFVSFNADGTTYYISDIFPVA